MKFKAVTAFLCITAVALGTVFGINYKQKKSESDFEKTTEEIEIEAHDDAVELLLNSMTLEEKVYQMMFVTPEALTGVGQAVKAGDVTKNAVEKYPVGGIIYFAKNIKSREQITEMIENTQMYSKIPVFTGVDEEGGRVARIGGNSAMGTTKLPPMADVKGGDEAYRVGKILGEELKELLFNVDFAPVADVIINESNSEIGDRSFGSDAEYVGECVEAVVKGIQENGVSAVLKHFPGHGSTVANSHVGYSSGERTVEELRQCEFIPFKKGIDAGCDFVMVSHMTLVNCDTDMLPSSLSKKVIEGYLKGELGFEKIVITDSLSMGAITNEYTTGDAAVTAVLAGNDMILMPKDMKQAAEAIVKAVDDGVITKKRIDESVRKILLVKKDKGLI